MGVGNSNVLLWCSVKKGVNILAQENVRFLGDAQERGKYKKKFPAKKKLMSLAFPD